MSKIIAEAVVTAINGKPVKDVKITEMSLGGRTIRVKETTPKKPKAVEIIGPMNSDPKWLNVILHPGTACSWTASQGYVVNDQRGRRAGNIEQLEKERDAYRRAMDEMKDELAKVKKECEILKRTMGLRAERVMEAVKKGANPRMLNLDVDGDE